MSEHVYRIKKGDIEVETTDKQLIMRIFRMEEKPLLAVPTLPAKKIEIRETETCLYLGEGGAVSKACVEEVGDFITSSKEPFVTFEDLRAHSFRYPEIYIRRAIQILKLHNRIESFRISGRGRGRKVGYTSLLKRKGAAPSPLVLEKEGKEAAERVEEEHKTYQRVIKEGLK